MEWNGRKSTEEKTENIYCFRSRVSIVCVYVCVRNPGNVYTFSGFLEGLSVLRGSCTHSHILLTQSTRTDGLGWVWRNPGTDFLRSSDPHSHSTLIAKSHRTYSSIQQQNRETCAAQESLLDPQSPRFLLGKGHVGATTSFNSWHFKLQERKSGIEEPRLVKQRGSLQPAKGQPTNRLCWRQQLQAFCVNAFHTGCVYICML